MSRPSVMSRMCVACTSVKEKGSAIRAVPRLGAVGRRPDGRDDGVEHVDGPQEALDDVCPVARLLQAELRAAPDHLNLVVDVVRQRLGQVQRARHSVDQGEYVHAEARLERRLLEQVVEHDVRVGVALELDDQARLLVGRRVAQLADAVEVARSDELGDLLLNDLRPRSGTAARSPRCGRRRGLLRSRRPPAS